MGDQRDVDQDREYHFDTGPEQEPTVGRRDVGRAEERADTEHPEAPDGREEDDDSPGDGRRPEVVVPRQREYAHLEEE